MAQAAAVPDGGEKGVAGARAATASYGNIMRKRIEE